MDEVIGLIPAGGQAKRISPLPCSKEMYPIGFWHGSDQTRRGPKVVCSYLLEKMRLAGIIRAFIVLRQGKWDIPAYFQDGRMFEMHLAYLMLGAPYGVPYTVEQAYSFVQNKQIAFGFPDILFQPDNAFAQLLSRQERSQADVILGLFPTDQPHKVDMVDVDPDGRIQQLIIRPVQSPLRYTWGIAVWGPHFTGFMHEYLLNRKVPGPADPELCMGDVFEAAIRNGMRVEGLAVSKEPYVDIGTPEDLIGAVRRLATL
jgi:glucose-1-phosphate thymidylyltransferase